MGRHLSILVPFTLLALLAGATLWLDQRSQTDGPVFEDARRHTPDTIVRNFSAARMDETGTADYTLSAKEMLHYPDDDSTHLSEPRLSHFESGKPPVHVRSDEGIVSSDGENIYFKDDVEVTREAKGEDSKLTVTTDRLHVIPEKNIAKTQDPVVIANAELHVTAIGMELNSEARTLDLHSQVKGRYEARSKK